MSTVYFDPRARNSRDIHEVKRVSFLGHLRPVILQNENGPCPLIALANAMLLLGWLHLDKKFAYVKLVFTLIRPRSPQFCRSLAPPLADA